MNETWMGTIALIGLIIVAIGCWFYMWGGRDGKWKRRFIGSLLISTAVWVECLLMSVFNFWQLLVYPFIILYFSLGYGSEVPLTKVIKRFIVVICSLATGVIMCLTIGGSAWLILPLQFLIACGSIWLGVKNPIQAAPEEFFVCLLLNVCNIMYPFTANLIK